MTGLIPFWSAQEVWNVVPGAMRTTAVSGSRRPLARNQSSQTVSRLPVTNLRYCSTSAVDGVPVAAAVPVARGSSGTTVGSVTITGSPGEVSGTSTTRGSSTGDGSSAHPWRTPPVAAVAVPGTRAASTAAADTTTVLREALIVPGPCRSSASPVGWNRIGPEVPAPVRAVSGPRGSRRVAPLVPGPVAQRARGRSSRPAAEPPPPGRVGRLGHDGGRWPGSAPVREQRVEVGQPGDDVRRLHRTTPQRLDAGVERLDQLPDGGLRRQPLHHPGQLVALLPQREAGRQHPLDAAVLPPRPLQRPVVAGLLARAAGQRLSGRRPTPRP